MSLASINTQVKKMNEFSWLGQVAIVYSYNTRKISSDAFLSLKCICNYLFKLSFLQNSKFHAGQEWSPIVPGASTI